MTTVRTTRSTVGAVDNPLVDERDDLAFDESGEMDVSDDVADALVRTYEFVERVEDEECEVCGEELDRGGVCERPADECPYHRDDEE